MGILFFCPNGYVFKEVYRPLIQQMNKTHSVYFVVGKEHLSQKVWEDMDSLKQQGYLQDYRVISPYPQEGESGLAFHQRIWGTVNELDTWRFDILVLDNMSYAFHKYMFQKARAKARKVVVLQNCTLWRLLMAYRSKQGLVITPSQPHVARWRDLARQCKAFVVSAPQVAKGLLDNAFWPLLVGGKVFPYSSEEGFLFASSSVDKAICYSQQEAQAARALIPGLKTIEVCEHPSIGMCRCLGQSSSKSRLLVVLGGNLNREMSKEQFNTWQRVIQDIVRLAGISSVDVRIHPRTQQQMQWPAHLCQHIQQQGVQVQLIRTHEVSLPDTVCDYAVVLGSPSGALRVARAACFHVTVLGMANCSDQTPDDQEWILGNVKGIHWIKEGRVLQEFFQPTNYGSRFPDVLTALGLKEKSYV